MADVPPIARLAIIEDFSPRIDGIDAACGIKIQPGSRLLQIVAEQFVLIAEIEFAVVDDGMRPAFAVG